MKKITPSKFIAASLTVIIIACSSDTDMHPPESYLDNIAIEKGIAVFEDQDAFNMATAEVTKFSTEELNTWEKRVGFISKRTNIRQAIEELTHANDVQYAQIKERLKDYFLYDDYGNVVGQAFPLQQRAILVNENGLVRIGEDLLIFKNDRVITIIGGDENKLKEAELLQESNSDKSIIISKYIQRYQISNSRLQADGLETLCSQVAPTGQGVPRYFQTRFGWTIYDLNNGHPVIQNWHYEVDLTAISVRTGGGSLLYLANFDLNYQAIEVYFSHLAGGSSGTYSKHIITSNAIVTEPVASGVINAFFQETPIATLAYTYVNTATDPSSGYVMTCSANDERLTFFP